MIDLRGLPLPKPADGLPTLYWDLPAKDVMVKFTPNQAIMVHWLALQFLESVDPDQPGAPIHVQSVYDIVDSIDDKMTSKLQLVRKPRKSQ